MAIRALRRKSGNRMLTKIIEVSCKVFSPFFSLKQSKVNGKNWGETNFEVSKKQKDVRMMVIEISIISEIMHAFLKYTSSSYETRPAVF